eukprot:TRINITY_DN8379_c0_g1_i4.p1 TRINITY_DN8379_c0_g1~~TRINITY_DN8379_c0_g1_i4.p1  ORF type:complete len:209 (+),score=65.41 TRINITY_DN8379_c0_g1_i4:87-629(+)
MSDKNGETRSKKEHSLDIPKSCIQRILKERVGPTAHPTEDAKMALQQAAQIWIFYLTHYALDIAQQNGRALITSQHVIKALKEMEFSPFLEELEKELQNSSRKKEKKTKDEDDDDEKKKKKNVPINHSKKKKEIPKQKSRDEKDEISDEVEDTSKGEGLGEEKAGERSQASEEGSGESSS